MCIFTNDIDIIAQSERELENNPKIWKNTLDHNEKKRNLKESRLLVVLEEEEDIKIKINDTPPEKVSNFIYLEKPLNQRNRNKPTDEKADMIIY